jgi:CheY-like chemotaxis protein
VADPTISLEPLGSAGARVLVVEDNAVNQKVAVTLLAKLGVRADVAAHGREALHMLGMAPYDLIFMDCQMPEMDGYETTLRLRQVEGSTRHTVVIALTADAMQGSRERCLEAGMDDHAAKPLNMNGLLAVLQTWLGPGTAGGACTNDCVLQVPSSADDAEGSRWSCAESNC